MTTAIRWKQDGYLWFGHTPVGMWTIEQHRGRFLLTLSLLRTLTGRSTDQDFGKWPTLKKAQTEASKATRALVKLDRATS